MSRILSFVTFFILSAQAYGSSERLMCGNLLDTGFVREHCQKTDSPSFECGDPLSGLTRYAPWFVLYLEDGSLSSDQAFEFLPGMADLFRFGDQGTKVASFQINRTELSFQLVALSGHYNRELVMAFRGQMNPQRRGVPGALLYFGNLSINLGLSSSQSGPTLLPSSGPPSNEEVHSMPFVCILEESL